MEAESRLAGVGTPRSTDRPTASVRVVATSLGAHLVLEVVGEADLYTAQALRDQLAAALTRRPRSVTLDVSHLTYCDLAGLDALNDFCAEASVVGVPPVVHGMSPRLAWMHARFPATDGRPVRAGGPTAPEDPLSEHRRWRLSDAHLGVAPADLLVSPRPWPER